MLVWWVRFKDFFNTLIIMISSYYVLSLSDWSFQIQSLDFESNATVYDLRNESDIFSVDWGINQKGLKTALMRLGHCCKSFPFFFRLIPWSTKKILDFISHCLIFNAFQDCKHSFKPLLNNRLFSTFNVVKIHVTSQFFNQSE